MPNPREGDEQVTTSEAQVLLGFTDRSTVVRMVRESRLTPARKLPGATGAYLFWKADIERIRDERAAAKGAA